MRRILVMVVAVVVGMCLPVMGQVASGIKDRLGKAEQDHDQQLNDAMDGKDSSATPTTVPAPANQPVVKADEHVVGQWVSTLLADGTPVRLYVARDENNASPTMPGLLVVQEWWGVNKDIQNRTKEFAARGAVAVAVDLYDGKTTADPKEAAGLKGGLTDEKAMNYMKAALSFMLEPKNSLRIDPARVGAIGWCMGGEQALKLAVVDDRVKLLAVFYGPLIVDPAVLINIKGPVLGVFGNDDTHPSPTDVTKFQAALKQDAIPTTIYQYDGAGHAFASESAKVVGLYRETQAKDAWAKTWSWLNDNLYTKK